MLLSHHRVTIVTVLTQVQVLPVVIIIEVTTEQEQWLYTGVVITVRVRGFKGKTPPSLCVAIGAAQLSQPRCSISQLYKPGTR